MFQRSKTKVLGAAQWGGLAALALAACQPSTSDESTGGYEGGADSDAVDAAAEPSSDGSSTRDASRESESVEDGAAADAPIDSSAVADAAIFDASDATSEISDAAPAAPDSADATSEAQDANAGDDGAGDVNVRDADADAASTSDAVDEPNPAASTELVYVVTYLGGIWGFTVNPATGIPTPVPGSPFDRGAWFYAMAVVPSGRFAYAVDIKDTGAVHSYRVEADGSLHTLGAPMDLGSLLSIAVDPAGKRLYVGDASHLKIEAFDIDPSSGALSARSAIETGGSTLYATPSQDGAFLYSIERQAGIRAFATPIVGDAGEVAGSPFGKDVVQLPGAMVAHPGGKFLYSGGTVLNGFEVLSTGALRLLDRSPFADHARADATAISVAMDSGGHHIYCTDNITRTLSAFKIDSTSGALEPLRDSPYEASPAPYSVAVDPSGRFVWVGQDDPSLVTVFKREPASGLLEKLPDIGITATGLQPEIVFARYPAR